MPKGWNKKICIDCAYNKCGRCEIANGEIKYMVQCPEHYTYELIAELRADFSKRMLGLPHGDILAREW